MKKHLWLLSSVIWLAVICGGSVFLMIYSHTPGKDDEIAPRVWPASSHLPRDPARPTLVMFAHPKCPCTRASIEELNGLMARCQGQVTVEVVFFRPEGEKEDWAETDLWRSAAAIPGVSVRSDTEGREAKEFHAATSGHVVLYDEGGKLLFSGGITEARGHAGDNAGRSSIVELLHHGNAFDSTTPTFGCPIQSACPPVAALKGS